MCAKSEHGSFSFGHFKPTIVTVSLGEIFFLIGLRILKIKNWVGRSENFLKQAF
jgi:hypothetical protein